MATKPEMIKYADQNSPKPITCVLTLSYQAYERKATVAVASDSDTTVPLARSLLMAKAGRVRGDWALRA